jgi:predicted transcriptional regulator
MRKTTLYLDDEQAERLRRLAVETQVPQAELIRSAINDLLEHAAPKRTFHSMGMGSSDQPGHSWTADELYEKVFPGRR